MVISDGTLQDLVKSKKITVTPLSDQAIQPASIDLRLGNNFILVDENKMEIITLDKPIEYRELEAESITIPAYSFILGMTLEHVEIPANITAFVEGRSSIGRMGLFIQNAGWIDPGFKGRITLQLYNANSLPIRLEAGRRVCQLVFCFTDKPAINPYKGKYQGQNKPGGSRIFQDVDLKSAK